MHWFVTCGLCVAVYTVASAATFTCPSLFSWHSDPTDCSKFYRCIWGKAQSFTCGSGTSWSQKLMTCDFEHHVKCHTVSSSEASHHSHSQEDSQSQSKSKSQENNKSQGGSDISVDLKKDNFQSQHKNPQKVVTEDGSFKRPLYQDKENQNNAEEDEDDDQSTHPDYTQDHQNDETTQPQNDNVVDDSDTATDLTFNHFPLNLKSQNPQHRDHDASEDGHWDYFYPEGLDNEELASQHRPHQDTGNSYSKLHSLQHFLEELLSPQRNTFQHHHSPRYTVQQNQHRHHHHQQQQRDVLAPAAAAQDTPPASAMETAKKQLFNDILVSKLLQHSQFSGYLYKPPTLINTDGTYDVLDVQLQTPDSDHSGQFEPYKSKQLRPTDPWPLTDFFRAGYGYKRIFHDK